jgi:hypothetical protein
MNQPFYFWGKSPRYPLHRKLDGFQTRYELYGEERYCRTLNDTAGRPARRLLTHYTDCTVPPPLHIRLSSKLRVEQLNTTYATAVFWGVIFSGNVTVCLSGLIFPSFSKVRSAVYLRQLRRPLKPRSWSHYVPTTKRGWGAISKKLCHSSWISSVMDISQLTISHKHNTGIFARIYWHEIFTFANRVYISTWA